MVIALSCLEASAKLDNALLERNGRDSAYLYYVPRDGFAFGIIICCIMSREANFLTVQHISTTIVSPASIESPPIAICVLANCSLLRGSVLLSGLFCGRYLSRHKRRAFSNNHTFVINIAIATDTAWTISQGELPNWICHAPWTSILPRL